MYQKLKQCTHLKQNRFIVALFFSETAQMTPNIVYYIGRVAKADADRIIPPSDNVRMRMLEDPSGMEIQKSPEKIYVQLEIQEQ